MQLSSLGSGGQRQSSQKPKLDLELWQPGKCTSSRTLDARHNFSSFIFYFSYWHYLVAFCLLFYTIWMNEWMNLFQGPPRAFSLSTVRYRRNIFLVIRLHLLFLLHVSRAMLTRDIDTAILSVHPSVCPSVCRVTVFYRNGLKCRHTITLS